MRLLTESVPVMAPRGFTLAFAWDYFLERAQPGSGQAIQLKFPLGAVVPGLAVHEPVNVNIRYVASAGAPEALAISWTPESPAAFPSFVGTLRPSSDGEEHCCLTLEGGYSAPGGIAGAAFDSVIGWRIARSTVEALLQQLRTAAEADYRSRTETYRH